MNLAYFYPLIYWNTANLIVDSASYNEEETNEELVSIYEPENFEEYTYEDLPDKSGKIKKQTKTVDYGKISMALERFRKFGLTILPPNVNISNFTFTPDEKSNTITYGLRGITRVSNDLINKIIDNRPYVSLNDFVTRVSPGTVQMANLIKSGAFDDLESTKTRVEIMQQYIDMSIDKKEKVTLQSMATLLENDLVPDEYSEQKEAYDFNKFLKAQKSSGDSYVLSDKIVDYISNNYDGDIIDGNLMQKKAWEKLYKKKMDPLRNYLKTNAQQIVDKINQSEYNELWNKYASGTISKWEMDSIGFYNHEHELEIVKSNFDNYNEMPEMPIVDKIFSTKDGHNIAMYKLYRIVGTIVNKDKTHNTISLLTPYGLVQVKIYKSQWASYDRQISTVNEDGKKTVLEKSWLTRGNLMLIQGFRRDDNFIPKKYKSSLYPPISMINKVNDDGTLDIITERMTGEE